MHHFKLSPSSPTGIQSFYVGLTSKELSSKFADVLITTDLITTDERVLIMYYIVSHSKFAVIRFKSNTTSCKSASTAQVPSPSGRGLGKTDRTDIHTLPKSWDHCIVRRITHFRVCPSSEHHRAAVKEVRKT